MAEHPDYRENIKLLNDRFPDHDMLTEEEAMAVTGYKSRNTFLKHMAGYYNRSKRKICKTTLARWMCGA